MRADTDHASDRGEGVNEGMGGGAGGWGPEGGGLIGGYTVLEPNPLIGWDALWPTRCYFFPLVGDSTRYLGITP